MSDVPPGPGWWLASDGNWYPPDQVPGYAPAPPPPPGYGPYGYAYAVAPTTTPGNNGYAIASLVVSIVLCGVGSFLAVIFGHVALSQIKRTGEGGRGLAIGGLVLGYVGIVAMIALIFALVPLANGDTEFHFDSISRSFTP